MAKKILIYRLGSLGDTVVALPCFHLIRRSFPTAELRVLTNLPISPNAPRLSDVLANSGLVDGYFEYPVHSTNVFVLGKLMRQIRAWGPKTMVYLAPRYSRLAVLRDVLFFVGCGVHHFTGLPLRSDQLKYRVSADGLFEQESFRLARCLSSLGDANPCDLENWDLRLTGDERSSVQRIIADEIGSTPFLVLCTGTKWPENDWGGPNWGRLVDLLLSRFAHKLVFIGGPGDRPSAEAFVQTSPSRIASLCGRMSVRENAALLQHASLYIGHDTGPTHLAAAEGTPLVAIFSNRNPPGVWFPIGKRSWILYPKTRTMPVSTITPDDAIEAVTTLLATPDTDESALARPAHAENR